MEKISNQISGGAAAQKMFTSGDLQQKMYEKIVEWLLEQGKIEEAISYLEKSNNEALNAKFKQLQSEGRNATVKPKKYFRKPRKNKRHWKS
jgi:hypothetical protein